MPQIRLFSKDSSAGMHHSAVLRNELKIPHEQRDKKGDIREGNIPVLEFRFHHMTEEDRAYHCRLVEEGKIAHMGQRLEKGKIVDTGEMRNYKKDIAKRASTQNGRLSGIPVNPDTGQYDSYHYDELFHSPDTTRILISGLDPAKILSEMYKVMQNDRDEMKDHPLSGKAEDYVAGIRIVDSEADDMSLEKDSLEITAEEFKQVADYMRGNLEANHPIAGKIEEIREFTGYKHKEEEVTLAKDGGTVGQEHNQKKSR